MGSRLEVDYLGSGLGAGVDSGLGGGFGAGGGFLGGACPKSSPSVSSTPASIAQKADCTLKSGLFGQPGGGGLGLPLSEVPLRSILRLASLSEVPQRQIG